MIVDSERWYWERSSAGESVPATMTMETEENTQQHDHITYTEPITRDTRLTYRIGTDSVFSPTKHKQM